MLTVTSYPTRTSPVLRGKWLLENVLGAPPPPPPPNIPALERHAARAASRASVRERMEQHRKNPVCASCHARMDPLGFALENFDAIGRWRTVDDGETRIDPSGTLPDGTKFQGPDGLRRVLLARGDQFVETLTEKLLTYALGRGLESYRRPGRPEHHAERRRQRLPLVRDHLGIAASMPFQMRLSADAGDHGTTSADTQEGAAAMIITNRCSAAANLSARPRRRAWRCRSSTAWCRRSAPRRASSRPAVSASSTCRTA